MMAKREKANTFIKLFRSILHWAWWSDVPTFRLFIYLLLEASFEDRGNTKRGQIFIKPSRLEEETGLTSKQIKDSLKNLRSTSDITTKRINKTLLISVVRYDYYQEKEGDKVSRSGHQDSTFIKLFRDIRKWRWWSDIKTFRVFIYLLIKANYEDRVWQQLNIKRGQIVTGRAGLALSTNLTESQVRTALKRLESSQEIIIIPKNKYSILALVNYDSFQGREVTKKSKSTNRIPTEYQQIANKSPADRQQIATIKELKKEIIKEEEEKIFLEKFREEKVKEGKVNFLDWLKVPLWTKYLEMRKVNGYSITKPGKEMILEKVEGFERNSMGNGSLALEKSITGSFKDVLEPRIKKGEFKPTLSRTGLRLVPSANCHRSPNDVDILCANMKFRIAKGLMDFNVYQRFFYQRPLEKDGSGFRIFVENEEALKFQDIFNDINLKIELKR